MLQLKCKICSREFEVRPYRKLKAKFCSRECYGISNQGKIPKSAFKKGQHPSPKTEFKKGVAHPYWGKSSPVLGKRWTLSKEVREAKRLRQKGLKHNIADEKHPMWKGNDVGYRGLHTWIERKSGKPTVCEFCGMKNLIGHKIHWANKSGDYKRDLNDWIRLCAKCHKQYDNPKK